MKGIHVLPDDRHGLAALLATATFGERGPLLNRLVIQLGDPERAQKLYDAAMRDVEHDENIDQARKEFRAWLDTASVDIRCALRGLDELTGGLYDFEYAETQAGRDMRVFLEQAARAIRAVQALAPARDGDTP